MPRKAKAKPRNPMLIASEKARKAMEQRIRDFAAVNLPPEAAELPAHADVEVRRQSQQNVETVRRADVFDLLRSSLAAGAFDAVRRLEHDMLARSGVRDAGAVTSERVDCTQGFTTDAAILAGDRVDRIVAALAPRDWWLLHDLITTRRPWRETVAHITGETHDHAQAAAVRAACVNLRDVSVRKVKRAA